MTGCRNKKTCCYITGFIAAALSLYYLLQGKGDLTTLAASTFFLLICISDTLHCRIPNLATLSIALAGFGYHAYHDGASGLLFALLGLLAGFILLILPYLLGGVGAGDVKTLAGLGSLLGAAAILQVFIYTCLFGGLLAILYKIFNTNLKEQCLRWGESLRAFAYTLDLRVFKPSGRVSSLRFPYAAAIAFGFYAYVNFGGLL